MMLSVSELFKRASVREAGAVPWGTSVPLDAPGVYIVATTQDSGNSRGHEECPLDESAVLKLLRVRPEATVDGNPAAEASLGDRLREMWLPGQSIVYIGLAGTSVRRRVSQFYRTEIGARAPHAGGWPVKMLRSQELWVHYGASSDPDLAELEMIREFSEALPDELRKTALDPSALLPYANLMMPRGRRKAHGISGVRASLVLDAAKLQVPVSEASPVQVAPALLMAGEEGQVRWTQNVTAGDIQRGSLRVPKSTKDIFPLETAEIRVRFRSGWHTAKWDPRTAGDRERSGTIRVGAKLLASLDLEGGPRRIIATREGYVLA